MLGDAADCAGLHVRRWAHLKRNPLVPQQRCESAQAEGPTGIVVDVVDDPHAVAEPVGTAERDGLMDGRQFERLAGVNGEAGGCFACTRTRRDAASADTLLRPGQSKTHHPLVRNRIASSAISRDGAPCCIAVTRYRRVMVRPRRWRPSHRRRSLPAPRRPRRPAIARRRCAARARTGSRRIRRCPPPGLRRTRRPPGTAPPVSASPRPCARTARGNERANRCARRCGRRRKPVDAVAPVRRSRSPRRAPAPWRAVTRRRGGHATGPSVPGRRLQGQRRGHGPIRSMISGRCSGAKSPTLHGPSISAMATSNRSGVSV